MCVYTIISASLFARAREREVESTRAFTEIECESEGIHTRASDSLLFSEREREKEIRNERKRERVWMRERERGGEEETFFFSLLFRPHQKTKKRKKKAKRRRFVSLLT